jgi:predicted GH43/DUF377 family glycosyl hydrolase
MKNALNYDAALKLAESKIIEIAAKSNDEFRMVPGSSVETDKGWVFFYNSAEYLKTGDPLAMLAGNGPIYVLKSGEVHILPTAVPWETSIDEI